MAYENIDIKYPNFCLAPVAGTFATVDTTNTVAVLQIRNSSGAVQANYSLNPTITQGVSIASLVYTGPTNTSTLADGMPFFTLEYEDTSNCTIKRWALNDTFNTLDLQQTLPISDFDNNHFECRSLSVEHYLTAFSSATASGTGQIEVDDTAHMEVGQSLYLGPSSHAANTDAFEKVTVTSISGSFIDITPTASGSTIATDNYYNAGDPITYHKDFLLFSDQSDTASKGTLFRLDSVSGTINGMSTSGIYKDVVASCYGAPYYNTVGFVKTNNVYYVDIDDYSVQKSAILLNTKSDDRTVIPVYDLAFDSTTLYRLQAETTLRDDTGLKNDYSWANYNYQQDGIAPYVDNIAMWVDSPVLHNQEQTTVYALVRDQYGQALSGVTVYFDKVSGDSLGGYDDINKQAITDSAGIASLTYTCGWSDPNLADTCCEDIVLTAYATGSNILTGSQYVWANTLVKLYKKFILTSSEGVLRQRRDALSGIVLIDQLEELASSFALPSLSKFWFPGGDGDSPSGNINIITQLEEFESTLAFEQWEEFSSAILLEQAPPRTDTLRISQTYISRHTQTGNEDTALLNQFRFLLEAVPEFWSEKNVVDTSIWIKLAPFGFDLDATTLKFEVREVSYAGDTGYTDYANTEHIDVTTFDAGSGLLGLDITVDPPNNFHTNAVVYVFITVYDKATPSNKITVDYWFKTIPDFKAPFIENELPGREGLDVPVDTEIEFDVLDLDVGVDISTLELYVDNRSEPYVATPIEGGYHIKYIPTTNFYYGQTVEIAIRVTDASDQQNLLFDTYRFHCASSSGPWIDTASITPHGCKSAVYRKLGEVSLNIYEINDTGLDVDSISLEVDNKERQIDLKPILLRIM